jgi:hypothetical protein
VAHKREIAGSIPAGSFKICKVKITLEAGYTCPIRRGPIKMNKNKKNNKKLKWAGPGKEGKLCEESISPLVSRRSGSP